jgi:multidrug resistance efflux pump
LGNLVSPLSFNVSATLCEMADLSDMEVELDITERDIAKVAKGMPCRIRAEAYPDRICEGVVDRLMPIANRAKGALPVRVKVRVPKEEEGVFLRPEMGAVVSFLQPEKKN